MIDRLPLRMRLTLWVVGMAAVIQLAVGLVFYLYQRSAVQQFFDEHLEKRSLSMIEEIKPKLPGLTQRDLREIASGQARFAMFAGFTIGVWDQNGELVATTRVTPRTDISREQIRRMANRRGMAPEYFVSSDEGVRAIDPGAVKARTIIRGFAGNDGRGYALASSTSDTYAQDMLSLVAKSLLIAFPTGVLVAGLSGWYIAGMAVRPLETVREAASRMSPHSIGQERITLPRSSPEQEKLEKELNRAMDRLSAAFAAQERFMSNVSHELKTPIAVMLTEAQTLDVRNAPREVEGFVRSTMEELRRLGTMVDSFLVLTRVREGRALTQRLVYPINEMVMDSAQHCTSMAQQYQVKIEPRLCEEGLEAGVRGDPALLRTMIDNLIRNAIRFSPRERVIRVSASCEGNLLVVRVRDFGKGIAEELVDKIFDRFVQAQEEHRRGRGHGLGLEIAQGIAELHGGRISVRNCRADEAGDWDGPCEGTPATGESAGCEFTVRLPRAGLDEPDKRMEPLSTGESVAGEPR